MYASQLFDMYLGLLFEFFYSGVLEMIVYNMLICILKGV